MGSIGEGGRWRVGGGATQNTHEMEMMHFSTYLDTWGPLSQEFKDSEFVLRC
jgi:hypothetical protein